MNLDNHSANNTLINIFNSKKRMLQTVIGSTNVAATSKEFIRFEEKKEQFTWAHPDDICFVKSADHYVKSLIKCGTQKKWMSRHCTIKELLVILSANNFIRLNKFYVLNRNHFSHINENEKILYFNDDSSIPVPHRISPYLLHLLNNTYT